MRTRNKVSIPILLALGVALILVVASTTGLAANPVNTDSSSAKSEVTSGRDVAKQLSLAFEHASELVQPSVVAIVSERNITAPTVFGSPHGSDSPFGGDLFRRFFGDRSPFEGGDPRGMVPDGRPMRGSGSGVIVSEDGYVLTNNHVIQGADSLKVEVDGEQRDAELVGADPASDLAVIKIKDAKGLPVATLGDSSEVRVGQWVIAVGNPFELMHTVTAGIVSAKGRSSVGLAVYEDFIQTDASINPGNSGGALADLDGRVIGINTAISSPSGGNVGIGFAIPIDMAKDIMADLIDGGSVARGYLGLMPQDLDESLVKALKLQSRKGALVANVEDGTPAAKAGLQRGDVIVALEGKPVEDASSLRHQVAKFAPGTKVDVAVLRDGKNKNLKVELGQRPGIADGNAPAERGENRERYEKLGIQIDNMTPEMAQRLGIETTTGVLVMGVAPQGAAAKAGLRRGDVIEQFGDALVPNVSAFQGALSKVSSGDTVAVLIHRGPATLYLGLEMP